MNRPPLLLDDARVLKYAAVDSSIELTGRLRLYVDGKRAGAVPNLAICEMHPSQETVAISLIEAARLSPIHAVLQALCPETLAYQCSHGHPIFMRCRLEIAPAMRLTQ